MEIADCMTGCFMIYYSKESFRRVAPRQTRSMCGAQGKPCALFYIFLLKMCATPSSKTYYIGRRSKFQLF